MTFPPIPRSFDGATANFMRDLLNTFVKELDSRPPAVEARASVLLVSPDGSVYSVAVDNAGVLNTTLVSS